MPPGTHGVRGFCVGRSATRAYGGSAATRLATALNPASSYFPRTPLAKSDARRERGADREGTEHRGEPDGVLVVENGVDAVQQGQARQQRHDAGDGDHQWWRQIAACDQAPGAGAAVSGDVCCATAETTRTA